MKSLLSMVLAGGLIAAAVPAVAQESQQKKQTPEEVFAQLDANRDNKLSESELGRLFANASEDQKKQTFAKWDADSDKSISMEEFKANYRSQ